MFGRAVRLFPEWPAFLRDLQNALQHFVLGLPTNLIQTLPDRFIDRRRHTFAGEARKFPRHAMRLFILNVQAHGCILPFHCTFLPHPGYPVPACSPHAPPELKPPSQKAVTETV